MRESLNSKIGEEKNLRRFAESFYTFLTTLDELIGKVPEAKTVMQLSFSDDFVRHYYIKILNFFDPELQLIDTKLVIKNKLKDFLGELKKLKVQTF